MWHLHLQMLNKPLDYDDGHAFIAIGAAVVRDV